jgi:hypothetical protein
MTEKTLFDMKNPTRLKTLNENAPEAAKAFWAFDKATFAAGGSDLRGESLLSQPAVFHVLPQVVHAMDVMRAHPTP